ncbi:MAG TPA: glycosyl hydrolase family 28 protein [Candidatus Aquilonibacter sp.]|nr:glycosyl hydrolase family 28 protein [Candidatus Aquilonibacter sp.]
MSSARKSCALNRRELLKRFAAASPLLAWPGLDALAQHSRAPAMREGRGEFGLWNPLAYGARGNGATNDTAALQRTLDACARAGGGTVVLPSGHTFLSGTLSLASNIELHLAGDATLLASPNRDDFRTLGSLLFAKDTRNVRIGGTGTIDGNFAAFFPPKGPNGYAIPSPFLGPYDPLYAPAALNPPDGRPRMILLVNCRNTELADFTVRDSPTWTIHPIGCDGLHVSGISILNSLEIPNCDGIDIDHCRDVRIEGCNIIAGDDCLVLKASRNFGDYGPCEGITITNCTLESSSAGIKIGNEGPYPLRSATVSNCAIVRTNRGISLTNRDGELVEDLLFTDMTIDTRMHTMMWWGSGEPVFVSAAPRTTGAVVGQFRGIQFANLACHSESGIYLRGTRDVPLRDLSFRGIDLQIEKTTAIPGGFYDVRPDDTPGASGLDKRTTAGFFAADVNGLTLSDVRVGWGAQTASYYGPAIEMHECSGVVMSGVTGTAAHAGDPAMVFEDVQMAAELGPKG